MKKCLNTAAQKLPEHGEQNTMVLSANFSKLTSIVLACSILLIACGGGSGGETSLTKIAPTVNAGNDQTLNENTAVTLAGTASDSDGSIVSYSWTQTAGTTVTLNDADSIISTFTAPAVSADETLIFQLKVTDDDGASKTDSVNIIVKDVAPTADAGVDQSIDENTEVTLSGSGTSYDGSTVSYSWTQITGISVTLNNADAAVATFTAPNVLANETLTFELTVTDNDNIEAVDSTTITVTHVPSFTLNDTGVTQCGYDNRQDECPIAEYEGQDAEYGRDALATNGDLLKIGAGRAGFDFTKLDTNGNVLPDSANSWSCVKDNNTGFIWEVKTNDGGLRDGNHSYTWNNTDPATNGGYHGENHGGYCSGSLCDTEAYVKAINNLGLCGANDWRLPNRETLLSLVDYGAYYPAIDSNYFPHVTGTRRYWSSSSFANNRYYAWYVDFGRGSSLRKFNKFVAYRARLVRGGK